MHLQRVVGCVRVRLIGMDLQVTGGILILGSQICHSVSQGLVVAIFLKELLRATLAIVETHFLHDLRLG